MSDDDFKEMDTTLEKGCLFIGFVVIGIILLIILFTSCNPFISKELRHKNKCNRKLERVVKKCPELLKADTINVPFEVIVPKLDIKDSVYTKIDTMEMLKYITKDKIKYVVNSISIDTLILDSLYRLNIRLSNGVLSYDIEIYQKTIQGETTTPIQVVRPAELTLFEKFCNYMGKSWKWIVIFSILFLIFCVFWKKIF